MAEKRDITKLPRWAQIRIANLEATAAKWQAQATDGPEDSDTYQIDYGSLPPAKTPLGSGARIVFETERGDIHVVNHGNHIEVSLSDGVESHTALGVYPRTSNVVVVRGEKPVSN